MHCTQCKLTIKHKHHTKDDEKFIKELFKKADNIIEKPHFADPQYTNKMGDRKNKIIWWVDEQLLKMGKRIEFPVPLEREYEKYE